MTGINGIVYPPTLDYHYLVQRPQQIMRSFSELSIPTYYLNVPSPNSPVVRGIEKINSHLHIFNHVDPQPYLKNIRPVLYFSATWHINLVQNYNPSLVVFDSVDEPCDEFASWKPYYDKALRLADVVLTTADKLYDAASMVNPNTYLVPNGCDYEFFSQARDKRLVIPKDIAGIKHPIIGYFGVIATWLDLELIEQLADRYPHCNIVMIGPMYNVEKVPLRPNIHWLGFKKYEELPSYAQNFDAAIIPFKSSKMVDAVNPIKMWEYMATGMPIVSTDLPEIRKYDDIVYHSRNQEDFINNIKLALEEDSLFKKERRQGVASRNSWQNRAYQITKIISKHLEQKSEMGLLPEELPPGPNFDELIEKMGALDLRHVRYDLSDRSHLKIMNKSEVKLPNPWEFMPAGAESQNHFVIPELTVKEVRSHRIYAV